MTTDSMKPFIKFGTDQGLSFEPSQIANNWYCKSSYTKNMVRYLCLYLSVTFQQPFCLMDSLHRMPWMNKYIAVLYSNKRSNIIT